MQFNAGSRKVLEMKLHQLINYTAIMGGFTGLQKPMELPTLRFSQMARAM